MALGWRQDYSRYKGFFLDIISIYKERPDIKIFLEMLLSLTAISLFSVFAIKPTALTIIDLVKQLKTKEETIAQMDNKIQNLNQAQAIFSEEQSRLLLLESAIPLEPLPDKFIGQVEGMSALEAIGFKTASIDKTVLKGKPQEEDKSKIQELEGLPEGALGLSFSLSFDGDYSPLFSFLSKLEDARRPLKIDSLGFGKSEKEEESGKINLDLKGRVPYYKAESLSEKLEPNNEEE